MTIPSSKKYCYDLNRYERILTREVKIGDVPMGGIHPIRIQSMTTTDTMDTEATVAQTLLLAEAGCEYVRITAPSKKEAENLAVIKAQLHKQGCRVPLVADIHYTPNAAEIAARIVEKVRVNPGNYADKKKFEFIEYTDLEYAAELERIYERFSPLVKICKEYGTAMRIGTNHGSLSDRIMSRYGDTAYGMVESAYEFMRICEDHGYYNFVISMKSSNTQVMVEAYRMLMSRMLENNAVYPLHLGVTEAGEGEDGRIKSAVGIGSLLMDGIGDTVRVSLTESPEFEPPVARYLVDYFTKKDKPKQELSPRIASPIDPYNFARKPSGQIFTIGDHQVPRVIVTPAHKLSSENDFQPFGHVYNPIPDKWTMAETGSDFVFFGADISPCMLPNGLRGIYPYATWRFLNERHLHFPLFETMTWTDETERHDTLNFVEVEPDTVLKNLDFTHMVLVLSESKGFTVRSARDFIFRCIEQNIQVPVVYRASILAMHGANLTEEAAFQLSAACAFGPLLIDGLLDGIWIEKADDLANRTAFGILQAARLRITKTEYISCPSCGRTLFDLMETTAMIRQRTEHLKGIKIGIMGCIVNGPGEMADADYGYVGSGPGIITLYRGKEVVEKAVKTEEAVDKLLELIKEDGNWIEKSI